MAYTTQPGTIPHRVLQHLKSIGDPDAEVSAPELAEALDVDISSIVPSLTTPCKHGALTRRKKEARHSARKVWWYALGDGTPEAPGAEEAEPLPQRIVRTPAGSASTQTICTATARGESQAQLVPLEQVTRISTGSTVQKRTFDAWLSASGAMVLQGLQLDTDGDAMLAPSHVDALRKLLGAPA